MSRREPDELVRRAQRGDASAFTELFHKHRGAVAAIAYRMLGPRADIEDVVQEVFLQVHRSLPAFRGQAKFSTWLHRVAVNVALMTRRRARSRPVLTQQRPGHEQTDARLLPDQDVARRRRLEAFRGLLDRLSEKKRTVFMLHEIEGVAPREIAKLVGCPVLTVRTRLFYARRELAQMMQSDPDLAHVAEQTGAAAAKRDRSRKQRSGTGNDEAGRAATDAPAGSAAGASGGGGRTVS